jgi:hypothetical protein
MQDESLLINRSQFKIAIDESSLILPGIYFSFSREGISFIQMVSGWEK